MITLEVPDDSVELTPVNFKDENKDITPMFQNHYISISLIILL